MKIKRKVIVKMLKWFWGVFFCGFVTIQLAYIIGFWNVLILFIFVAFFIISLMLILDEEYTLGGYTFFKNWKD